MFLPVVVFIQNVRVFIFVWSFTKILTDLPTHVISANTKDIIARNDRSRLFSTQYVWWEKYVLIFVSIVASFEIITKWSFSKTFAPINVDFILLIVTELLRKDRPVFNGESLSSIERILGCFHVVDQ